MLNLFIQKLSIYQKELNRLKLTSPFIIYI